MAITAKKTPTQELARFLAMYEPGIAATARAALARLRIEPLAGEARPAYPVKRR